MIASRIKNCKRVIKISNAENALSLPTIRYVSSLLLFLVRYSNIYIDILTFYDILTSSACNKWLVLRCTRMIFAALT